MSPVSLFVICLQASIIQLVFGQCLDNSLGFGYVPALGAEYGPGYAPGFDLGYGGFAPNLGYNYGNGPAPYAGPSYGGAGIGDVSVGGEMPVAGTTLVAGQVPILGAVQFGGEVPAGGVVTISGRCGCGCNAPYAYK